MAATTVAVQQSSTNTLPSFASPGGMWMPEQLTEHTETLKELGLEIELEKLSDPLQAPLAAVVSIGHCSASFVSASGLMLTNHHCVQGALQHHSSPEANYVEDGFLAKTLAEEKWNGPSSKVWVTHAMSDVTEQMLSGIDAINDPRERNDEIETRQKKLIGTCEADRPHMRCRVASYFGGAEFKLIESLEIRDIRLVYAPHKSIGVFGGDKDNWMWPRHTGDFSFYRAYVGPDGEPADFSEANLPYQPKHFLTLATSPLEEGDLVMVAGYPGRTYRHRTAAEIANAVEWYLPYRIDRAKEFLATIGAIAATNPAAKIKATSSLLSLSNVLKNNTGVLDSLGNGGLAATKAKVEAELQAWILSDEARTKRFGNLLDEQGRLHQEEIHSQVLNAGLSELGWGQLLVAASTIVQMAEERPKSDMERKPSFQKRQWSRIEARFETLDRRYDPELDAAILGLGIERAMRNSENAAWLEDLFGHAELSRSEIDLLLASMYKKSKLDDAKVRLKLLKTASLKQLARSRDPFIAMAMKLRPLEKKIEDQDKRIAGKLAVLKPRFLAALREHSTVPLAPDANSTLRVTFGTVKGYQATAGSIRHTPFTVMSEIVGKHKNVDPFDVPDAQLAAIKKKAFGPYVSKSLGEVPVNFLTDLDTTGGNSGSATLNAKGELVGVIFDGNYESMASDFVFMPKVTRSIHCDSRYMLWIMDAVEGADRLLVEMGVTPTL